jgi:hypothetical protein
VASHACRSKRPSRTVLETWLAARYRRGVWPSSLRWQSGADRAQSITMEGWNDYPHRRLVDAPEGGIPVVLDTLMRTWVPLGESATRSRSANTRRSFM